MLGAVRWFLESNNQDKARKCSDSIVAVVVSVVFVAASVRENSR